jgi:hypothetical protein
MNEVHVARVVAISFAILWTVDGYGSVSAC